MPHFYAAFSHVACYSVAAAPFSLCPVLRPTLVKFSQAVHATLLRTASRCDSDRACMRTAGSAESVVETYRALHIGLDSVAPQASQRCRCCRWCSASCTIVTQSVPARRQLVLLRLAVNSGPAVARNAGIAWTRRHGAYVICFLDADCAPAADWTDTTERAQRIAPGIVCGRTVATQPGTAIGAPSAPCCAC